MTEPLPLADLLQHQADSQDDQVAREEISLHYAKQVDKARAELEKTTAELHHKLATAEAAQAAWDSNGELTSSTFSREPRGQHSLTREVLSILLTVEEPSTQAWKVAMAEPRDQDLRADLRDKQARVQAVKRWLAEHGHADMITTDQPQ